MMRIISTQSLIFYLGVCTNTRLAENPLKLEEMAMQTLKNSFEDELARNIIERIYPDIFNTERPIINTGFLNTFFDRPIPASKIDLSNLKLTRIPKNIVERIEGLEILNLSDNQKLKLEEEWFEFLFRQNDIRELSLSNCNLNETVFEILERIDTLESLNISNNINLNIQTETFARILKNLKHLNISNCKLDYESLLFIFESAENLISLNYNLNSITVPFESIAFINNRLKKSLESLSLASCNLDSKDLEYIFIFENLKEIDLTGNNFEDISNQMLKRIFKALESTDNEVETPSRLLPANNLFEKVSVIIKQIKINNPSNIYLHNLKRINLRNCRIYSLTFVNKLFNIEGLESLNLSGNILPGLHEALSDCKCRSSLKKLEIKNCMFFNQIIFTKLSQFEHLEYLDISKNFFVSLNVNFNLMNLKNSLIYLNIDCCNWNHNGLKAVAECKKLEYLSARLNAFSFIPINFDFKELKNTLKEVYMSRSRMNTECLIALTQCKCIQKLVMDRNEFWHLPPEFSLNHLQKSLVHLNISRCNWDLNGLRAISHCSKLKYLVADCNNFQNLNENFEFNELKDCLKEAYLNESRMNHHGLIALTKCSQLELLEVSNNPFDNLPLDFNLGLLKNSLRVLKINNTGLKGRHLRALTNCLKLKHLEAKYNFYDLPEYFRLGIARNSIEYLNLRNSGVVRI